MFIFSFSILIIIMIFLTITLFYNSRNLKTSRRRMGLFLQILGYICIVILIIIIIPAVIYLMMHK